MQLIAFQQQQNQKLFVEFIYKLNNEKKKHKQNTLNSS